MFTKVVKHNVRDKKQLDFDLRLTRYLIGNNYSFKGVASAESLLFFEGLVPQYHLKHPTTFTR